jgi:epsilon-lactone hydrolase
MHDRSKAIFLHPLSPADSEAEASARAANAGTKGQLQGIAARGPFDDLMSHVLAPQNVSFERGTVGGVSGMWVKPATSRKGVAILYMHGGWFNFGSAQAYKNLVGQITVRAEADAFIPDYRLAPEHCFPAAVDDVRACYRALTEQGISKIALAGDSAGGALALVLLSITGKYSEATTVSAVAISPITDLTMTGGSYESRAEIEPYFTKSQVAAFVEAYLKGVDPKNPLASPLYGDLADLPPVVIHVGDDEILLDDSTRYVERALAAGMDAQLHVWSGMPHVFVAGAGKLQAADKALDAIGVFIAERFGSQVGVHDPNLNDR